MSSEITGYQVVKVNLINNHEIITNYDASQKVFADRDLAQYKTAGYPYDARLVTLKKLID